MKVSCMVKDKISYMVKDKISCMVNVLQNEVSCIVRSNVNILRIR